MRRIILLLLISAFMVYADKLEFCRDIIKQNHDRKALVQERVMCRVDLSEIYPTQPIVGEVAVDCKVEKLEETLKKKYDGDEKEFRDDYLCQKKTFLPIVIGFKDRMYITDHHHLSSAVLKSKKIKTKELNAFILHDYSHNYDNWEMISESKFWFKMNKEQLVYLKDNGKIIGYEDLPTCLNRLKNDSFRTLSRWVRESGCYSKDKPEDRNDKVCKDREFPLTNQAKSSYYAEFKYADILRDKFKSKIDERDEVKSLVKIYPRAIDYLKSEHNCSECKEIKNVDKNDYCKKFD